MYKKILLATDGSTIAIRAVEKVIQIQKSWNCKVVTFHSIKHSIIPEVVVLASPAYGYLNAFQDDLGVMREGKKLLEEIKFLFDKEGLSVETRLIEEEYPEDYITRIVKEEEFDLVVLGVKGVHSTLRKIIIGSVAENVVKHAPCDVLVIH